jgi:hypothetical protein
VATGSLLLATACLPLSSYQESPPHYCLHGDLAARVAELEREHVTQPEEAPNADEAPPSQDWVYLLVAVLSALTGRYGDTAAKKVYKKVRNGSR